MLVALAISSLIANSSASGAVVLLVRALENDTCWPKFQRYTAKTAYKCLENIILISVTTTRVEEKKEALRYCRIVNTMLYYCLDILGT